MRRRGGEERRCEEATLEATLAAREAGGAPLVKHAIRPSPRAVARPPVEHVVQADELGEEERRGGACEERRRREGRERRSVRGEERRKGRGGRAGFGADDDHVVRSAAGADLDIDRRHAAVVLRRGAHDALLVCVPGGGVKRGV